MSGGSFDYAYFKILELADDIELAQDKNEDGYSEHTMDVITECNQCIVLAAKMAKAVEWLYSGDIGEETFRKRIEDIVI